MAPEGVRMLTCMEQRLVAAVQNGFPLVKRPFQAIGLTIGMSETEVLEGLQSLLARGFIKRIGVVLHHHTLGYQANAMVVFDVPDHLVQEVGARASAFDFVSLCYLRHRSPPDWPYNFYCMIHGRKRDVTQKYADLLTQGCDLTGFDRQVLFSQRRFKQCGAHYFNPQ